MTIKFDQESFLNKIMGIVDYAHQSTVERKVQAIQEVVTSKQNLFFPTLSKLIIKSTSAPYLDGYGEVWEPLSSRYTSARLKKTRGAIKENMFYRGVPKKAGDLPRLGEVLPKLKSMKQFGEPVVSLWQEGTYGRSKIKVTGRYAHNIKTGRRVPFGKVKNLVTHISVDLFPNIVEDISTGTLGPHLYKYLDKNVSYKLTNSRGKEKRPIITPYIKWWINIYMKRLIRAKV